MAKTRQASRIERATLGVRQASDRQRALYVGLRKALAPRTTRVRSRVARSAEADGLSIPVERGYEIVAPGRFPEAEEIVTETTRRLTEIDPASLDRKGKRKQFMIPLVDVAALDRSSPLLRLALRADVLAAVASYLGTAPLLSSVNVYLSRSTDRELMSSQLFHCDADDVRQVKVFVLCSEVTRANGPLMVMAAADSEALRGKIGYRYRDRVTDEEARAAIGDRPLAAVEGPPGTVCFVDTSRCFHYGSRVGEGAEPRLAAMLQYLTPHSFMLPRDVGANAPFKALAREGDPEIVRLALGV